MVAACVDRSTTWSRRIFILCAGAMSAGARFGIGLRSKRDSPSCGRQISTASERNEIQPRSHVLLRSADREFLKKSRNAHDAFQRDPGLERLAGLWAGKLNPNPTPATPGPYAAAAGPRAVGPGPAKARTRGPAWAPFSWRAQPAGHPADR